MGRDVEYPLTPELEKNTLLFLEAINLLEEEYERPMFLSSGYRPGHYNKEAHGAEHSAHVTCEAADFHDPQATLNSWCEEHPEILERCGLYMEDVKDTPGWCHLTTRAPRSGHRIFRA